MVVPIPVREVMHTDIETLSPAATVQAAAETLREHGRDSLVVTDGTAPVGVVSAAAIVDSVAATDDISAVTVDGTMARDPVTVAADTALGDAATLLDAADRPLVPVVDDGDLAGVLRAADVGRLVPHVRDRPGADGTDTTPGRRGTAYGARDWEFSDDGERPAAIESGETFRFEKDITDADVEAFARASGDTNRLHLDPSFAEGSRFEGRIAHGMLVASVISATLARLPGTVIYLSQSADFVAPVDIGERVHAVVTAAESLGDGRWRLATRVFDSDDRTVVDGDAVVLVEDAGAA